MIGFRTSQERRELIEQMKPERMATDAQWTAIKWLGATAGAAALVIGGIELAQHASQEDNMSCPTVVNIDDMPECQ